MSEFKVAHIRRQGVDLIVIPVSSDFGRWLPDEQREVQETLQRCATSPGLAGTVVPVWDDGNGRMRFLAPTPWHPFFRSIGLSFVYANINHRPTCF